MKILLIEDNEMIIKALKYLLESHEFIVDVATTIKEAKESITSKYDLIILDVMLPDGNGLDFFKNYVSIPALVLSAKDEEKDVVKAIDLGVQDYIIKPFRSMELLSRINNIIKRNKKNTIKEFENIKFDMDAYKIYVDNIEVVLTGLELKILFLMLENSGCLVTREGIGYRIDL